VIRFGGGAVWAVAVAAALGLGSPPVSAQVVPLPGELPIAPPVAPEELPFSLTPTFAVAEEYNDNVFLNNADKRWDFITSFTPGLILALRSPAYRLGISYDFSADVYARNEDLTDPFSRQNLAVNSLYTVSPRLALNVDDHYFSSRNTNLTSPQRISTGFGRSSSNSLRLGATWRVTPVTTVRVIGSYIIERFELRNAVSSDTYGLEGDIDRQITGRLTGTLGYQFTYFDIERAEVTLTHTPRVGIIYRLTDTLTASVNGGPSFLVTDDDLRVKPAATVELRGRLPFGTASVQYDRSVSVAGGLGGTTDNQVFAGQLTSRTFLRGLTLALAPYYTIAESSDTRSDRKIDIKAFTVSVEAIYRFNPLLSGFLRYAFFHERSGTTQFLPTDLDQNRLLVGLQFGYPIRLR